MKLYERYPDLIVSKYSMVTFSHIPYAEAKAKGEILVSTVSKYCEYWKDILRIKARVNIATNWH